MDDRDTRTGIDPDRTEGSMKQIRGKIKEHAGALFGDKKLKNEGRADKAEGKLQNSWGSMKDTARAIAAGKENDDV